MNQQMSLLEARAVARDREHRLRPVPRRSPSQQHGPGRSASSRRLSLGLLRRRPVAAEVAGRHSGVAAVRG